MSTITLKGMTWSHPRGYDPMVACAEDWLKRTGVSVEWDKRSLQDFESFPVEELARRYDLIVIDHPHVGQITAENCLAPLDVASREAGFSALAKGSVGKSFPSYNWQGRQWAFPIDAATQVLAFRPDRLAAPPTTWAEVLDLARAGEALLPLRPPHSLMCLFSLCGNLGRPCSVERDQPFVDAEIGVQAIEMIRELAALVAPACIGMDPIAVLDHMGEAGSPYTVSPLIYGYVSYSLQDFRANRIAFADMPVAGANGPVGSALGGTGIAVSAFRKTARPPSTSPTGLPAGRCRPIATGAPAASRAMPRGGRTRRPMPRRSASIKTPARRWKVPGCGHAMTDICHSRRRRRSASTRP